MDKKSEDINRWIGNRFFEHQHPFRSGGAGMEDFSRLIPLLKESDVSLVKECALEIEKLLENTKACTSCTAKIYVYLSAIYKRISKEKSDQGTRMMYQLLQREDRSHKKEVYGTLSELPDLLSIEEMRWFLKSRMPSVEIPKGFYCVTDVPAPLAGMPDPIQNTDWNGMMKAGIRHVVNLADDICSDYDPTPLKMLYSSNLEDLCAGRPPRDPEKERRLISDAVDAIVPKLIEGEGVVIHCIGGRGRTGTVMGCVLKRLSYSTDAIVKYLNALHRVRGKEGWPESEWQSSLVREFSDIA